MLEDPGQHVTDGSTECVGSVPEEALRLRSLRMGQRRAKGATPIEPQEVAARRARCVKGSHGGLHPSLRVANRAMVGYALGGARRDDRAHATASLDIRDRRLR
jgi:hypothetical protein